ncbi:MAG: 4Fe-4S cluster-binding domain-containing protein, partial [Oscillospiraceae bacterium]
MPAGLRLARAGLHLWEEPCISGTNGSGAVFFSGCNLRCVFCQNGKISAGGFGKAISVSRLREIFDDLIARGAHNINLVSPTQFTPWILQALDEPLPVPVVWNSGGYETVETLQTLAGKVQIYLPDLK